MWQLERWKAGPLALLLACGGASQQATPNATLQRLPTGNYLDPAVSSMPLGSFPVAMVLSPEGDRVVVLLNGWREQGIQVVERSTGRVVQTVLQPAAFIGLTFSPDGKTLYVSGGNQDVVYRYDWRDKSAMLRDSLIIGAVVNKNGTRYPAGLFASGDGSWLYVAENLTDSLAVIDLQDGRVKWRLPVGRYPYAIAPGIGTLEVSSWGEDNVVLIKIPGSCGGHEVCGQPVPPQVITKIQVGRHPSAMVVSKDLTRLYVASATTDRVSVVDLNTRRTVAELYAPAAQAGEGSTPNALSLSADESRLYVAEADNNAVAVWNLVGNAHIIGRVPVEWYPTALIASGDTILVANGKGKGTGPNPALPHPGTGTQNRDSTTRRAYTLGQLDGSLMTLTAQQLGANALGDLTKRVASANGWHTGRPKANYPPITHAIYIIKENRTYDQVLGDMTQGDGDTSLVFFPRNVSPNHHALAERFGLFDRFFVNAEVSADGHNWTTAAYVTDYLEKTVQSNYSSRGRTYDYEGENRGRIPSEEGKTDAAEPATGYLWDLAQRAHVTLRNYGEYVIRTAPGANTYRATKPFLDANTNREFPEFDMEIFDTTRANIYLKELQQFAQAGSMPQLQIIRLPRDHTSGARVGANTPRAMMADNDWALGRIVEGISKSPFWKNTVIFVLEDDAQNGPDHVDSHRSPLLVISPYNRGGVIHRFANTTDVIATIADILGMGSLSQFDQYGRPLRDVFSKTGDFAPYAALKPGVDLNEKNAARGRGAIESRQLKLAREDESDDDLFNRILWRAIKGENLPYPGSTRAPAIVVR